MNARESESSEASSAAAATAAGCCGCLQRATSVPTEPVAMKSIPSSGRQQNGPSFCLLAELSTSLLGSPAALTYPPVTWCKSEAEMPSVTASGTPGQQMIELSMLDTYMYRGAQLCMGLTTVA